MNNYSVVFSQGIISNCCSSIVQYVKDYCELAGNSMTSNKVRKLIESGEGIKIEFKSNRDVLSDDLYETICAFLNTGGGEILFGVEDDGWICGINPDSIDQIEGELITVLNNHTKVEPSLSIDIRQIEIDGKKVLACLCASEFDCS